MTDSIKPEKKTFCGVLKSFIENNKVVLTSVDSYNKNEKEMVRLIEYLSNSFIELKDKNDRLERIIGYSNIDNNIEALMEHYKNKAKTVVSDYELEHDDDDSDGSELIKIREEIKNKRKQLKMDYEYMLSLQGDKLKTSQPVLEPANKEVKEKKTIKKLNE